VDKQVGKAAVADTPREAAVVDSSPRAEIRFIASGTSLSDGSVLDRPSAQPWALPTEVASDSYSVSFSVIIVTKGRPEPLREALESSAIMLPAGSEVIVVDGDLERSAYEVVCEIRSRFADADIGYIPSPPGMTLQRNIGIDAAGGEVVLFIDDDCKVEPGLFDALAATYEDPTVVGATGRVGAKSRNKVGPGAHSRLRWLLVGGGRQGTMSSFGFRRPIVDVEEPRDVEFMPGAFMSARRDVAAKVRFDEGLNGYCLGEDDDFAYRLSRQGRICYRPGASVFHQELGVRTMDPRQMNRLQVINRAYLFRKNFAQTLRARAGFTGLLLLLCTHRILNREWSSLHGLIDGMRDIRRSA
jgi:GT2 family glycosyltransferase